MQIPQTEGIYCAATSAGSGDDEIDIVVYSSTGNNSDYLSKIDFLDGGEGYDILEISSTWPNKNYGSSDLQDVIVNFEEIRLPGDSLL